MEVQVKVSPQLDPQLINLLRQAKHGDSRTLLKLSCFIKQSLGVDDSSKRRDLVSLLIQQEDFMEGLLVKFVKTSVNRNAGLVLDGLWIFNVIAQEEVDEGPSFQEKLDVMVNRGLVPVLARLLSLQDHPKLHLPALDALEQLALWQYDTNLKASGSLIVPGLNRISRNKNCSVETQMKVLHVIGAIMGLLEHMDPFEVFASKLMEAKKFKSIIQNLPGMDITKEILNLLDFLLGSKDKIVLSKTLGLLFYLGNMKGIFRIASGTGMLRKLCELFTFPDDDKLNFLAFATLCEFLRETPDKSITAFLKSMKGTHALASLFNGLNSSNTTFIAATYRCLGAVLNTIAAVGQETVFFNGLLHSGLIEALVVCMKAEVPQELAELKDVRKLDVKVKYSATWLLGRISSEVNDSKRRIIVDYGALPCLLEQMMIEDEVLSAMAAATVGNLAQPNDPLINSKVIPQFIKLLRKERVCGSELVSIVAGLELVVSMCSERNIEALAGLFETLKEMMQGGCNSRHAERLSPGIFLTIAKVGDIGPAGVSLIVENGWLTILSSAMCGTGDKLFCAMDAIETVARKGNNEHKDALINEADIVSTLVENLLNSRNKYARTLALSTLSYLYKRQLTPGQRKKFMDKMPTIQACLEQSPEEDPRVRHPAATSFQDIMTRFKDRI